ncbi:MAG: Gfo/Idh/MocA family oxidoreductase [Anaerolineales bacterium]|nr:Gfo/Idh/MocA family oxidoreductase [Anaerolineales bacterium]
MSQFVAAGGALFAFAPAATAAVDWPAMFGARPCGEAAPAEFRVLFRDPDSPLARRLPAAFYMRSLFQPLTLNAPETRELLYADWQFTQQPVLTSHPFGEGVAALTTLTDSSHPLLPRIIYRLLYQSCQMTSPERQLGIGILGYAPSVGQLHGQGASATAGLSLEMICDLAPDRLQAARQHFPAVTVTESADEMMANEAVDLVIIATPPNVHAALTARLLASGKHVVCEKPLAVTLAEAEAMQAAAQKYGLHLSCHQNRRWNSDYLMIKQALADGLLGQPFYLETFVGGYGHPCGFWHSHAPVSGGTTFDWGAHYLDWMLDLLPGEITGVICTRQNRLWHDITNADRERIQLRYADGSEAEFTHSDLAFIPKPKWYLVGTEGALLGQWRQVDSYTIDPLHYYQKHEIPASEMGADITVRRRDSRGNTFTQTLPEPARRSYAFHANLADHLLLGEPLTVPLDHTMRVMAVLEAARQSAAAGGQLQQVSI